MRDGASTFSRLLARRGSCSTRMDLAMQVITHLIHTTHSQSEASSTYLMGKLTMVGFFSTKKLFLVNL